ncbi:peptidylprolyl isomerase [Bacteroides sp. OttesenSCG-928-F21]|nr:peptidylprolyl isomerase [Bacteroides sp. OttesenSCG-928-F21]
MNPMKLFLFQIVFLFLWVQGAVAQQTQVVVTIDGQAVYLTEYLAFCEKQRANSFLSGDNCSLLEQFINNKLKIAEAERQGLFKTEEFIDSLVSFEKKLMRAQFLDKLFKEIDDSGETNYKEEQYLISQIFRRIPQRNKNNYQNSVASLMDSLHARVAADPQHFAGYVEQYSDDKELRWVSCSENTEEFERELLALNVGEISHPFFTPAGMHIVRLVERRTEKPTSLLKEDTYLRWKKRNKKNGKRGLIAFSSAEDMPGIDSLLQEYREELLLSAITRKEIVEKVSDEVGLRIYFETHKKQYAWKSPRYRGIVLHCRDKKVEKEVKKIIKNLPFNSWKQAIETTYNQSGVQNVIVESGLFAEGDNPYVDDKIFKKGNLNSPIGYSHTALFGKKTKKPESYEEVLQSLIKGYEKFLEKLWITRLRSRSKVEIHQEVLKTVNNN